jgi:hypothetical protein
MKPDAVQNGKTDTNNNGAFSTGYIGGNYEYPDGDCTTRARIAHAHVCRGRWGHDGHRRPQGRAGY